MKKVILSFAVIGFSMIASARSIDQTPVVATVQTVQGSEAGVRSIALLADGRLQIVSQAGKTATVQLSSAAYKKLVKNAVSLSNTEINKETRDKVCQKFAVPTLSDLSIGKYNEQAGSFEGKEVNLILTAQGCELSNVASPADDSAAIQASELRAELVILALNSQK